MINIGDIVEVCSEGCKFVAYYKGEAEHNGKNYIIVSPYDDNRPNHWLEPETEIKKI